MRRKEDSSFLKKESKRLLTILSVPALKKYNGMLRTRLLFLSAARLNMIFLVLFFKKELHPLPSS
jgi:hypothetical protein